MKQMASVNREMLALARESRRKTQTALAEEAGVVHSTISKVESGMSEPSEQLVEAYAKALRYPIEFFYTTAPPARLPVAFYRKKKSKGVVDLRTIEAQMRIACMHLDRLLRSVEPPPLRLQSADLSKGHKSASDVADELRMAWHVKRGPIPNVTALIEAAGVFVLSWNFDIPGVDALSIWPDGLPPVIMVDTTVPGDRLRFTLCHELGHLILHHQHVFPPEGDLEAEANEFASAFLMPRDDIKPFLSGLSLERMAQLKMHWRASMQSILVRAADLGAITEAQSQRLWKQVNYMGLKRAEPVEIPREMPTMAKNLVGFHMKRLGYSAQEMSRMLPWNEEEFTRTYLGTAPRPVLRVVR